VLVRDFQNDVRVKALLFHEFAPRRIVFLHHGLDLQEGFPYLFSSDHVASIQSKRKVVKLSFLSFLRKHGETEDPLFVDLPVETPPPDEGDAGFMAVDASQVNPGEVTEDESLNG
jgi:hypothetical protein